MDNEIAGLQLRQTFERNGAAKPALSADATPTPEYLVVGQHAHRWLGALQHETATHRAQRDLRARWNAATFGELNQFFQPLQLAAVIAQDVGVFTAHCTGAEQAVQLVHVALDGLGRARVESNGVG